MVVPGLPTFKKGVAIRVGFTQRLANLKKSLVFSGKK